MDCHTKLNVGELVAAIVQRAAARPRIVVGIDGPGASGKSTLAGLLAAHLTDHQANAAVVHVDDFYLPSTDRGSHAGALLDLPRLAAQVVLPAASGTALRYQRYDWSADSRMDTVEVPPHVPVIVEGVYCLQSRLRQAYSYSVFCRADPAVRLRRGLDRDGEDARATWVDEWMPAEDRYIADELPDDFADLVVDSSVGADTDAVRYDIQRWNR